MENEKHPFKLSKVNWIFALIVIAISTFIFLRGDGINAYSIGTLIGRILFMGIVPLIIALAVWFIRNRKYYAGTHTFNIVLTLLCLGMLSEIGAMSKERDASVEKITTSASDYKEKINNEEDATAAFEEHSSNVNEGISKMINNSSGNEQKVFIKLQEFSRINQKVMLDWQKSYDSVMRPRILDYSVLNTPDEFEYQTNVIKHYLENTRLYRGHFNNRKTILKQLFSGIPSENKTLIGVMTGINQKDSVQMPVVIPYADNHISYGNNLIKMLEFLKNSSREWEYQNNELIFESTEKEEIYLSIIEKIGQNETEINDLAEKLIEVL